MLISNSKREERRHGANNSVKFKGRLCLLQLTGEVEAAVPVAFGRRVGWWGGAGRVALLEGRWRGRCGRGGGGRVAAGVQLVQHRRVILAEEGRTLE